MLLVFLGILILYLSVYNECENEFFYNLNDGGYLMRIVPKTYLESALRFDNPVDVSRTLQFIYWQCFAKRTGAAGMRDWLNQEFPNRFDRSASGVRVAGKRQPSQEEALYASLERLEAIESLSAALTSCGAGLVVGGSLSYGPFYCVRSGEDPSDVDVIVTIDADTRKQWELALHCIADALFPLFRCSDTRLLRERIGHFDNHLSSNAADILSQKLRVDGGNFEISIHFFSETFFDEVFGRGFLRRVTNNADCAVTVRDFRADAFASSCLRQRSFSGRPIYYLVTERQKVEGGAIIRLPAYLFRHRIFYPGIYSNVVSPGFHVWSDPRGNTRKAVDTFREAFMNRWLSEKRVNGETCLACASHVRYPLFRPLFEVC